MRYPLVPLLYLQSSDEHSVLHDLRRLSHQVDGGAFAGGAFACGAFVGGAFDGVVEAAVSSGLEERPAVGDSVKGGRTTTSSGVRPSLDAGVGGTSTAAVTGVDDDMGAGLN